MAQILERECIQNAPASKPLLLNVEIRPVCLEFKPAVHVLRCGLTKGGFHGISLNLAYVYLTTYVTPLYWGTVLLHMHIHSSPVPLSLLSVAGSVFTSSQLISFSSLDVFNLAFSLLPPSSFIFITVLSATLFSSPIISIIKLKLSVLLFEAETPVSWAGLRFAVNRKYP